MQLQTQLRDADTPAVSFRAKWTVGCLALAGIWIAFAATKAPLLLGLAGAVVAVFGLALAHDWASLATAMRRSQSEMGLRQSAVVYRFLGYFAVALGLAFIAAAIFEAV
jgi:hypothetical protein